MMASARLRFFAELNDLLSCDHPEREICYEFSVAPSVKDIMENLGVPHTEVSLIVVNGGPVDFTYRPVDGDRVSVYPAFTRVDLPSAGRLRRDLGDDIRFVVDGHLGALARYLRLIGFDTAFDPNWSDRELAGFGVERVLLTRDRGLLKRRAVIYGAFVRDNAPDEQLVEVVRRFHLSDRLRPFTRCMACNGDLEDVDKSEVADRVGPRTGAQFDRFRRCQGCGRVYWQGSHWGRLLALVERARSAETEPSLATTAVGARSST